MRGVRKDVQGGDRGMCILYMMEERRKKKEGKEKVISECLMNNMISLSQPFVLVRLKRCVLSARFELDVSNLEVIKQFGIRVNVSPTGQKIPDQLGVGIVLPNLTGQRGYTCQASILYKPRSILLFCSWANTPKHAQS